MQGESGGVDRNAAIDLGFICSAYGRFASEKRGATTKTTKRAFQFSAMISVFRKVDLRWLAVDEVIHSSAASR
jgi:hypothetical protein